MPQRQNSALLDAVASPLGVTESDIRWVLYDAGEVDAVSSLGGMGMAR